MPGPVLNNGDLKISKKLRETQNLDAGNQVLTWLHLSQTVDFLSTV
jgi:hypothetical protein